MAISPEQKASLDRAPESLRLSSEKEQELLRMEYACSRMHGEYSGSFTPLGICRTLLEGDFSPEARGSVLSAVTEQMQEHFGHTFELFFIKIFGIGPV